ncbi:MAG: hypothetical protein QMD46_12620 [Methanomicrobiales archaeon]|nr:hypothetical protein [Methanomicrobiales archaeon]
MIATPLFIALLLLDAALIAIAFFAVENRLFADILSAVGSAILTWYLAIVTLGGNVGDAATVPLTTAENITTIGENITTGITTLEYGTLTTTTVDPALGLLLSGVAAVMTIVSLGLIISLGLEIMKELQ